MSSLVLGFRDIDKTKIMAVGGKGANLGELSKIEGLRVPDGFCISTEAFKRVIGETPAINALLDQLSLLKVEDRDKIAEVSGEIRRVIEETAIPEDIIEEITPFLTSLGENNAYAVRSSATAEDLPAASFAGQQDTYLNIIGRASLLKHIRKCWASLFTERAIIYRLQNDVDHGKVCLSVVIQKMAAAQAAGILFTADPVTSNRKVLSIDAGFGLGEALVSGLVTPDNYKVRNHNILTKHVSAKKLAIYALNRGGTKKQEIEPERQHKQVLADEQILQLERMARKIEEHFRSPQDIEWCLVDDRFYIVQSRPITTLYPIPETTDQEQHVYLSVGHQQMMTGPMKPLGISLFQLTAFRPMFKAGGRLFVDVTRQLASPVSRENLLNAMGQHDPLMKDALMAIIAQGDFINTSPHGEKEQNSGKSNKGQPPSGFPGPIENNPAIVSDLIARSQTSLEALKQNIQTKSGTELFEFILEDMGQMKKIFLDPRSSGVITAAMEASAWINEKMSEWLGEQNAAYTLAQSVPNNITSEMGLALLDLADVIRPYPEVIDYLQHVEKDNFLDDLAKLAGGQAAREAINAYLDKYGMRCAGEIDITKPRWSEKPTLLIPMILSNIRNVEPHAGTRKYEQGRQQALKKEQELLDRLKQLPEGKQKAEQAKRMISLIRDLGGYREYPKYSIVNRYFIYKQALLKEAEKLVQANVLHEKEDAYYLTFEEFREAVRTRSLEAHIIGRRKDEHKWHEKLTPPRVITSDGEIVTGRYQRGNLPAGALAGLAASPGVVEGRARVILNMEEADLNEGDILVTSFTDPSWTPLFVVIKGLVTEVGGLMTHGTVIAREYGLPAVIGVEKATKLITDGQRIRVHGTAGYVEIL